MMRKLWKRLFVSIAAIFVIFALAIALTSSTLMKKYYEKYESAQLAQYAQKVLEIDLSDQDAAEEILVEYEKKTNFQINIYEDDRLVYSTVRRSINQRGELSGFDFITGSIRRFNVSDSRRDSAGGVLVKSDNKDNEQFLLYSISGGEDSTRTVEMMIRMSYIEQSAAIASRFCMIITSIGLICTLVWCVFYARRFSKPLSEMNKTAIAMANLDFSRKVVVNSNDEIGDLATSINHLSESLHRSLVELQEKNKQLEKDIEREHQLDVMRKAFVANVSHELKTPISIIKGYGEGLRDGMANDDESRHKYCDVIIDESDRMYRLVINLLELSRYESGGIEVNKTEFDLPSSVLSVIDRNGAKLEDKQAQVVIDLPEKLTVYADQILIEQAISNYLSNAASHVEQGGKVRVYTEKYKDAIRLCVYNSGSSVAKEDMENIWQSFYRADKSHNRKEGRFGLGLSIVSAIVSAHHCDCGVFNTDDGVTFWLEISLPDKNTAAQE